MVTSTGRRWSARMARAVAGALLLGGFVGVGVAAPAGAEATGSYLVQLRPGQRATAVGGALADRTGAQIVRTFSAALQGYAVTATRAEAERLAHDPRVLTVEPDQRVTLTSQPNPTGIDRIADPANPGIGPAGLPIDGVDQARVDADIAIIDTGVDATHPDLAVVGGADCLIGTCSTVTPVDPNGHGTHTAGTAAAIDNGLGVVGVAPGARVWSVRVLDANGSGTLSAVAAGIDWVTARASQIEVANISLGCVCSSPAVSAALAGARSAGVTLAVAAGNDNINAAAFFPANDPNVVTVSAVADFDGRSGGLGAPTCRSDVDDTKANFSNFGTTVELAAPGACIRSTWPMAKGGYNTISGTSMAAPHVAGAAALLASQPAYHANPSLIASTLIAEGNTGWLDESGDGVTEPLLEVTNAAVFTPVTVAPVVTPVLSISDAYTVEGAGDETFNLTLSSPPAPGQTVSVVVATAASSATAGSDYTTLPATTVSFAAGQTAASVVVPVLADNVAEGSESFLLNLTSPVGVTLDDTAAYGIIGDDEVPLTVSVGNAMGMEGDTGTSLHTFTIALSTPVPAGKTVTMTWATTAGTATAGSDFVTVPATPLSFVAGEQSKTVSVTVNGDTLREASETYSVTLASIVGAGAADSSGTGTIVDEEGLLQLSVANTSQPEGDAGTSVGTYTVVLDAAPAAGQTVTVSVSTGGGTATAGSDYVALPATTLTFAAGETTKTVGVTINGDVTAEPNESITLNLANAVGAAIVDTAAGLTLVNDDGTPGTPPGPSLGISDARVVEGGTAQVTLQLATPAAVDTSVLVVSANGTATAGSDYTAVPSTRITFLAGETTKVLSLPTVADSLIEPAETFTLTLSSPVGLVVADTSSTVTVQTDEQLLAASVSNAYVVEGGTLSFTVSLSAPVPAGQTASVKASTKNSTALAGSDFTAVSSTLSFTAGQQFKTVVVTTVNDAFNELSEALTLDLTVPSANVALADAAGTGTIIDTEGPAQVRSIGRRVAEGDSGSSVVLVTLQVDGNLGSSATVKVVTANGSAIAGSDYLAVPSTTVTFAAGQTQRTIGVTVIGDTTPEVNETVAIKLSSPAGMNLVDSQSTFVIATDD